MDSHATIVIFKTAEEASGSSLLCVGWECTCPPDYALLQLGGARGFAVYYIKLLCAEHAALARAEDDPVVLYIETYDHATRYDPDWADRTLAQLYAGEPT